jgi:hypothetical protein
MKKTLILLLPAPVPVGHQVEGRTFVEHRGRFSGGDRTLTVLRDLTSGTVYGPADAFEDIPAIVTLEPRMLPWTVRRELEVEEIVRGRVTACQVALMGHSEPWTQTMLEIEIEG